MDSEDMLTTTAVIRAGRTLDSGTVPGLRDRIRSAARAGAGIILVDLTGIAEVEWDCLGMLLEESRHLRDGGGCRLGMVCDSGSLLNVSWPGTRAQAPGPCTGQGPGPEGAKT